MQPLTEIAQRKVEVLNDLFLDKDGFWNKQGILRDRDLDFITLTYKKIKLLSNLPNVSLSAIDELIEEVLAYNTKILAENQVAQSQGKILFGHQVYEGSSSDSSSDSTNKKYFTEPLPSIILKGNDSKVTPNMMIISEQFTFCMENINNITKLLFLESSIEGFSLVERNNTFNPRFIVLGSCTTKNKSISLDVNIMAKLTPIQILSFKFLKTSLSEVYYNTKMLKFQESTWSNLERDNEVCFLINADMKNFSNPGKFALVNALGHGIKFAANDYNSLKRLESFNLPVISEGVIGSLKYEIEVWFNPSVFYPVIPFSSLNRIQGNRKDEFVINTSYAIYLMRLGAQLAESSLSDAQVMNFLEITPDTPQIKIQRGLVMKQPEASSKKHNIGSLILTKLKENNNEPLSFPNVLQDLNLLYPDLDENALKFIILETGVLKVNDNKIHYWI